MRLQQLLSDDSFRRFVHTIERHLAKWLGLMLMVVLLLATLQLSWVAANDLIHPDKDWLGGSLIEFLDQLLLILIGLELLQTVTAYLRDQSVQIELVIITALTALSRKLIIHPPGSSTDSGQLLMVALAVLGLSAAYWLVRQSHRNHHRSRRGLTRSSREDHPSPPPDGDDGEQSTASHRH